jgi:aminomethyltransferase
MSDSTTTLKRIALHDTHVKLGAKMVPFAGYDMPVQYSGVTEEHLCVRNGVGIFDVSHMGEFVLEGEGALDLIQKVTSNDASVLEPGKVQYSCMPNGEGGIVDDLLVYRTTEEQYILVVNASNIEKDWNWIQKHNEAKLEMKNVSDNITLFAVQGPKALEVIQPLVAEDISDMSYYTCRYLPMGDCPQVLLSTTGYTGAGGYEIYVPNSFAPALFEAIMAQGAEQNIQPIGLAARDTLRLEMGFCLYGNDIDDHTSPIEAGLGWITKFTKDFIDRPRLERQKAEGVERKLVGFKMLERGIPRQAYPIVDEEGENIGVVTSGTMSPVLGHGIGMGYVTMAHSKKGSRIYIQVRNKRIQAEVLRPPFIPVTK